jgi:hypothetical protein
MYIQGLGWLLHELPPPCGLLCTVSCLGTLKKGGLYTVGMGGSLPDLPTLQYGALCTMSLALYKRSTVHAVYTVGMGRDGRY